MAKPKEHSLHKRYLKTLVICLSVLILFPMAGCFDAIEIDEEVYTLSIGIDKGIHNAIRVTFQFPTYKKEGGGGQEDKEIGEVSGTIITTVEAASLLEAINIANAGVNRQISLMHAKILVLSEDFARVGVGKYIEPLARFRDIREVMRVVVCRGTAQDFIKENKADNPSKALELMFYQSKNTGYYPDVIFSDFYVNLLTPYGQAVAAYGGVNDFKLLQEKAAADQKPPLDTEQDILPGEIPREGGAKRELYGMAIFDGDRMVGALTQYETRYYLMGIGEFRRAIFTFQDEQQPDLIYVIEIKPARNPRMFGRIENGIPVVGLDLQLEGDFLSIQSRQHYERLGQVDALERTIESYFEKGIRDMIVKTQEDYNADIFGFGRKIAGSFKTIQEFDDYNWINNYRNARAEIKVSMDLRRSGYTFGATPIRSTNEKKGVDENR